MWPSFVTVLVTAVRAGFFGVFFGFTQSPKCPRLCHSLLRVLPVKAFGDVRGFLGRSICLGRGDRLGTTQSCTHLGGGHNLLPSSSATLPITSLLAACFRGEGFKVTARFSGNLL